MLVLKMLAKERAEKDTILDDVDDFKFSVNIQSSTAFLWDHFYGFIFLAHASPLAKLLGS